MLTHLENPPHSFVTIFCQGKLNECLFVCKYLSRRSVKLPTISHLILSGSALLNLSQSFFLVCFLISYLFSSYFVWFPSLAPFLYTVVWVPSLDSFSALISGLFSYFFCSFSMYFDWFSSLDSFSALISGWFV